ncbi:hypothetical protein F511_03543 [Dorcoceras hygrometricum]|uniref:Uncharacterized protein n=1 Tax=Dorcoceras hygrometricum TaxID=472368 RepID=A0A2Z7BQS8_9LAMI|nr:hypothetical protein F511_03543 [Dorcoceras hygrometricum]
MVAEENKNAWADSDSEESSSVTSSSSENEDEVQCLMANDTDEVSNSVFEGAVTEFFANAEVIEGTIVSFVANRKMVITKDVFAEAFGLPTEGAPNKKKEMKMEYRLLHDIVAKALCAKAGSLDVVTSKKFDLMVAISAGLKSQGFAMQLSVLLKRLVKVDLGEAVKLNPQRVLNNKSVHTYMKKNLVVGPAGETSKVSGATTSEQQSTADSLQSLTKKTEKEVGEMKKPDAVKKKKNNKEKLKKGGAAPKCKLFVESSDSESTVSLPIVKISNKQRTQRKKLVKKIVGDQTDSNAGSIPENPAAADNASIVEAPEANLETNTKVERQADDGSTSTDQDEMVPSVPRTRAIAALRRKQIALDNQSHMIRCLRAKLATESRESAAIKKEHESTQVALEASHMTISGLTEIGLCMSKKIERMKAKKQHNRDSRQECHHKWQARIDAAEDTIQEQHLIIEALVEEKASLHQTIQGLQEDNGDPAPFDDE